MPGNLEPGQDPDTYTFTIPDDFEPGDYTWAWTWVNKIAAQPEFYMNCAPISVTAAAGSTKRVRERRREKHLLASRESAASSSSSSYPDLFLANIGSASNGCTTSEAVEQQIAIAFPYPGSAVSYPNGQDNLFAQACDGNPRNNNNNGAAAGSSSGGVQPSASGGGMMSIYPVGTTLASATSSIAVPAATTTTIASTSEAAPTTSSVPEAYSSGELVTTTAASSTLSTIVTSSVTASSAASSGTSTLGDACTDGHLLCVGGTQFSTCTGGVWDAPQDLAAHTTCEGGEGVGLTIINHY